jgi:ligand-binding SRPBCC domain-containing protein
MSISVCPIATINAPIEKVWRFVSEPNNYTFWWNGETRSIIPEGYAEAGQKIYAQTAEFGRKWNVNLIIDGVDEARHHIDLTTMLPFGITVQNHISCFRIDKTSCRVSFG